MSVSVSTSAKPLTAPQERRYLALWLPLLPIDRLRRERPLNAAAAPEPPLAVVAKLGGVLRLTAVDRSAQACRLTPGLSLSDARARVPELAVATADPPADLRLLADIAALCERFTPLVALDPPDGVTLDVTGCAHLFGDEAALQRKLCRRLRQLGLTVSARLAGTPAAARALARFEPRSNGAVPEAERLRALPIMALGVEPERVTALARAGLRTLGELAERPSALLAVRFGEELMRQLQRTLGLEDLRIVPLRAAPDCFAERQFAEPMTQAASLSAILDELIADTSRQLEIMGMGGRTFELSCFRSDGMVRRIRIETGRPSRDARAIARLFDERLDALADPLDPGFGFDAIRLGVPVAEPLAPLQPDLDGSALEADAVGDLVDRLVARLGAEQVLRYVPRDTHDPARAVRIVPAQAKIAAGDWTGAAAARPILLYDRPQLIETIAEVPDGPPIRFRWRRLVHVVTRAEGPERIAPEWWRRQPGDAPTRDYYRIEDREGRRFWVFREGLYGDGQLPRWFVHGLFA